ncbi:hypothetical protein LY76DRAFT_176758 [Colletotrichum caudatum]|nr:hypothetical protein LY76DRAFT_176758 [Colletotrichum caudatum]
MMPSGGVDGIVGHSCTTARTHACMHLHTHTHTHAHMGCRRGRLGLRPRRLLGALAEPGRVHHVTLHWPIALVRTHGLIQPHGTVAGRRGNKHWGQSLGSPPARPQTNNQLSPV